MDESKELVVNLGGEDKREDKRKGSLIRRIISVIPGFPRGSEENTGKLSTAELERYATELLAELELRVEGWEIVSEKTLPNGNKLRNLATTVYEEAVATTTAITVGESPRGRGHSRKDIYQCQLEFEPRPVDGNPHLTRLVPVFGNATVGNGIYEDYFEIDRKHRRPSIWQQSCPYHQDHVSPAQKNTRDAVDAVVRILSKFPSDEASSQNPRIKEGSSPSAVVVEGRKSG